MSAVAHIVSVGARTPVGLGAAATAAAVRAGIRRTAEHPFMIDGRGDPLAAAVDPALDPVVLGMPRVATLACSALDEALSSLPPETRRPGGVEVLLALPETRPGFSEKDALSVVRAVGAIAPAVEIVARGHAGALEALRLAVERVVSGRAPLCAVLGADSYFAADTLDWLESHRQVAGEGVRNGFTPGEGAGCVVVATKGTLRALRLPSLATVRGAHAAREADVIKGDSDGLGRGLTQAVQRAAATLALPEEAVDDVYCDINGERYRTDEWVFTLLRVQAVLRDTEYLSPASSCGDVGAASGALLCVLAVRAWERRYARGPRALLWCSSEAGLRAAAILQAGGER